jgi:multidrug efflux pump subunit AcrA (membrane-fusion protein)
MTLSSRRFAAVVAAIGCFCLTAAAEAQSVTNPTLGISKPSEQRTLAFPDLGVVKTRNFREGDLVKAGDVILAQDDAELQEELKWLTLQAESEARVTAATADLGVKRLRLERINKTNADAVAKGQQPPFSNIEREQAELEVVGAEANLQLASEQQQEAAIKANQARIRIARSQLKSPLDGIIQKLNTGVGEVSGPTSQDGAVVVVKNDPLWIDVDYVRTPLVNALKLGEELSVRYSGETQWHKSKVIYFDPVADAGSDTRRFRLELANPQNREAGRNMDVMLPEHVVQVAAQDATARTTP